MSVKISRMVLFILVATGFLFSKPIVIKFATLAPDGSSWMKIMREFAAEIKEKTDGQVIFKIYPGGIQGDEKDVLRKIRINQLQGAGFTGVGMGEILPEVRVLDTPFFFKNYAELDYVLNKFDPYFAQRFKKKGFTLIGWAEVGSVYIFTSKKVQTVDDFKKIKMWIWEGDPVAEATFKAFGLNPIPLSVTDVLTSLQTGLIEGVYTSPLACLVLQWFTKVKYVVDVPLTISNGAVLISNRAFKKISPEYQQIVRETGYQYFRRLTETSRKDNETSLMNMQQNGIQLLKLSSPENLKRFDEIGEQARRSLIGKLYDEELLIKIESTLQEFRTKKNRE
ncbi:TRAP transporter substrate-binding protein [Calditrichota bacterium GD2]